tara:strand:- start:25119 stop:25241 length:123 start_codon:yes stop_codon:yes gene_type:complete
MKVIGLSEETMKMIEKKAEPLKDKSWEEIKEIIEKLHVGD